jgi:hypothetical protein
MLILFIGVILGLASYLAFPDPTKKYLGKAWDFTTGKLAGVGQLQKDAGGQQQASFTLLEGTVNVKKAASNTWVVADYQLPLEKGDVIKTGSEGLAKVVFPDGTNYNVKQDSLIVIEENSANEQQTNVKVQLTIGTVDLSTGTYSQGSKSQVIVGGATASFSHDTSAMVRNDPKADEHEILVKRGEGQVNRGAEQVKLAEYEQVTFKAESPKMVKEKQIAPPTLVSPGNMLPIFLGDPKAPVQFSWSPVSSSVGYRIRISRNPYFSSTVFDESVAATNTQVSGLGEGAFYWMVQSEDINGRESVESERNRFTVIRK